MNNSSNSSAVLDPTETPETNSTTPYSLSMMFSSTQAQQAMVAVSPVSTIVSGLGQCTNQQFYLATAENFFSGTMMFVSCDTNQTETTKFMNELLYNGAPCVVFYSQQTSGCSFDPHADPRYRKIPNMFTMLSAGASSQILSLLNTKTVVYATISSQTNSESGSSNALIALYVIVAIIALFLLTTVMIGAVRLRRHPERYGIPSAEDLGYRAPYATRARGLARAVLDSIPLVRVAEPEKHTSTKEADVGIKQSDETIVDEDGEEYFDSMSVISSAKSTKLKTNEKTATCEVKSDAGSDRSAVEEEPEPVLHLTLPESARPGTKISDTYVTQEEDLCPICFENFMKDEILRALPCNHRFHADCVDPWLLNESSECPLCRIDLALVRDPHEEPAEPVTSPRYTGRLTQRWRKLVRSRRQRLGEGRQ